MPTVKSPTTSGLSFQARLKRLRFSVGAPIWFDFATQHLTLDTTPTRDPNLKPLTDVQIDPDSGAMSFAVSGSGRSRYRLHRPSSVDRLLLRGLHTLHQHGCVLPQDPQDSIEFEFTGGVADSMILRHTYPDAERETLRIFREDGVVYRMVPVEVIRTPVRALHAADRAISCHTELGTYEFGLRLPSVLRELTEELVNAAWADLPASCAPGASPGDTATVPAVPPDSRAVGGRS